MTPSFLDESYLILICRGHFDADQPFWAYVKMSPLKAKALKEAQHSGAPFDLRAFGEILEWGQGEDVPDAVKVRMEAEYGVCHELAEFQ
jgi:hypothetical protein